jgi:tryptophan-rich sensory protein
MPDFLSSKKIPGLAVWLVITFIAAAIGAAASINAGEFYMQLARPAWAPPAWLFGPVWSLLYLSIGVAAWLVWQIDRFRPARLALSLYLIQLVFNALWSWLFFGLHQGALAFADILLLWALIVATFITFRRAHVLAGWLMLPYLLWVSFAAILNFAIWQLNPVLQG